METHIAGFSDDATLLGLEKATTTYDDVNKRHSALLMRRDSWDADDATAFATLTAEEVEARKALAAARAALRRAEEDVSSRQVDYIDAMRRRYHEEQMWQDRWRVLGTYGTWTLIGLNSVIFLGGQFFHYRRETSRLKSQVMLLLHVASLLEIELG